MSMGKPRKLDYSKDGRTKQSFRDVTDINKILVRAQKAGTISHLAKYEGFYGDFAEFDFSEAQNKIAKANTIFAELPSELRSEFDQNPRKFFEYANDPENVGKLAKLLPGLAEPGRQFISLKPGAEPPAGVPAQEPSLAEGKIAPAPAEKPGQTPEAKAG